MQKFYLSNSGFTIIELLFSIALLALIAILSLPSIKEYKNAYFQIKTLQTTQQKNLLLLAEIEKGLAQTGAIFGINSIKIHQDPINPANTPSYLNASLKNNPQKANSSAFSFIFLDPLQSLVVLQQSGDINQLLLKTCLSYELIKDKTSETYQKLSYWLLVSLDGVWEFSGTFLETNETCDWGKIFLLSAQLEAHSMFETNNTLNTIADLKATPYTPSFTAILPILQGYTLYVDKNNTLRRIDHNLASSNPVAYNSNYWTTEILAQSACGKIMQVNLVAEKNPNLASSQSLNKKILIIGKKQNCEYLNLFF
ncbi:MAG: prepilin-type N-terminal cleavage/methylation domain-containing protein [Deltaproteobacteria bacterium]|jgi:prepilin-type N-terminal cleavage/methylation domain-containing protein|nr:prepilin-type N-terminal cleavage/methylation domain-containing protein [Deltaproteobacteria bacterium]